MSLKMMFLKELIDLSQGEYIISDATQIDKSVLKTDELVIPELMRLK